MGAGLTQEDRCPGVLRPHRAEDGLMIRLRLPGGRTDTATLRALGALARAYGQPSLQLTTRAGIQLRGLPEPVPAALVEAIAALGLLPSRTHERARTILCSPLTGIAGGHDDLCDLVGDLDRAVRARPELAALSGRFCFALDDGRGDLLGLPYDLAYRATSATAGVVRVGAEHGFAVSRSAATDTLADLAVAFVAAAATSPGRGWQVRDLPDWPDRVAPSLAAEPRSPDPIAHDPIPYGAVAGAASVHVPLGLLTPAQVAVLTATDGPVVVTPWRGLVLSGQADRLPALVASGLVGDGDSAWTRVSACVGAPHCARTTVDTRAMAVDLVRRGVPRRTHVSGCGRRCGAPTGAYADVVPVA